jgi:inner membrane protein
MAAWSALSLLPDADVIGFSLGVEYVDPWGHRGATHSLTLAVAAGLCIGVAARWFHKPVRRSAVFATIVLASHGFLDTLTDGGLGCALFWPFDLTRYFAAWRPIPVAPIGVSFLSPHGLIVSAIELAVFAPLFFYALRPRRLEAKRLVVAILLTVWAGSVWLIASGDPVRDSIIGAALRRHHVREGFSEARSGRSRRGSRIGTCAIGSVRRLAKAGSTRCHRSAPPRRPRRHSTAVARSVSMRVSSSPPSMARRAGKRAS